MKSLSLFFAFMLMVIITNAQDRIILKKGESREVQALQLTETVFYYKMHDYHEGPILQMPLNRIKQIEYSNGVVDYLWSQSPRMQRPFSVSFNASIMVSTYDASLLPRIDCGYFLTQNIEAVGSFLTDFYSGFYSALGGRYHFANNFSTNRLSPYAGFLLGLESGQGIVSELPMGLNYACFNGLNISAGLSFILDYHINDESIRLQHAATLLNLSVGWRF